MDMRYCKIVRRNLKPSISTCIANTLTQRASCSHVVVIVVRMVVTKVILDFIGVDNMLDTEEVKDLIEGRLRYRKCPCCDSNARVWYDGRTGEGALPYEHPSIPKDELAWETCDNCDGLSYILYY